MGEGAAGESGEAASRRRASVGGRAISAAGAQGTGHTGHTGSHIHAEVTQGHLLVILPTVQQNENQYRRLQADHHLITINNTLLNYIKTAVALGPVQTQRNVNVT